MRYFLIISALLFARCAQQVPPSGGPKDSIPPQVVHDNTVPKNQSTHFNSKTIVISFDEYVKLNNPNENIIISPAMKEKPEYLLKGKKLYIKLKGELQENTTYSINFGNCITDITENNPASGLTYVFSTGAEIDSLKIRGNVTNAFTNFPEKGVWVLLHKNLSDTAFQKCFPDYLTKTDADGNFELQNLREGEYKIYALRDDNSDYKYNLTKEDIAFQESPIYVKDKSPYILLRMFNETSNDLKLLNSRFIWPGRMQMVYNKSYPYWNAFVVRSHSNDSMKTHSVYKNAVGDTVDVWLRKTAKESGEEIKVAMQMNQDSMDSRYDTVSFRVTGVKDQIPEMKVKSNASQNFNLYGKLKVKYDRPVFLYRKEKIHLFKNDTTPVPVSTEPLGYGISFVNKWEEKTKYKVIFEDSVFADVFYGKYSKQDTIEFTTAKKDFYGNLFATVVVPDTNYIIELLEKDKVINSLLVTEVMPVEFLNLNPGNYKLRIFHDENNNKKWDTGNMKNGKQPEKYFHYKETIVIRSNWDFELNWKIEN